MKLIDAAMPHGVRPIASPRAECRAGAGGERRRVAINGRKRADVEAPFTGRIQPLSRVHSLLSETSWGGTELENLIRVQLSGGTVDQGRVDVHDPAITLEPAGASVMTLILHELATNSVKYGALSQKRWAGKGHMVQEMNHSFD